ncbi:MAG: TldD protein [Acidimicrobiia bacterium]|jgi:TldD protein|nr:TldD protein [Acidimicrobiia bacterium]
MIDESVIRTTLHSALSGGGDFAELFVEDTRSTSAVLDDGRVEDLVTGRDRGAGIRVVVGDTTGYAHTADLSETGLEDAARAAAAVARGAGAGATAIAELRRSAEVAGGVLAKVDPAAVPKATKVALLRRADEAARATRSMDGSPDDAIVQVAARYSDTRRRTLVANSEGVLTGDDQVKTLFSVSCVARGDAGLQTGRETVGRTCGFELFDVVDVEKLAELAAGRALRKLHARPAPSGTLPVVIASGSGGILFHEACGHGLEADLVAKGASVFAGRRGQRVASPLVTVIDDGTMAGEWGWYAVDDEGNTAQRNVLISDGVLSDYMWDRLRSRKEGRTPSGNGRRQSYRHLPMVRMTNTFIGNGATDPADISSSVDRGVYVAQLGGGQVNTATGDFVFGMTEAYLIENGEITDPIRDGNLIGNGPDALAAIDAVGTDFAMGGPGTCGKDGQGVPVGTGTPTLRVPALTVGGTAS